MIVLLRSLTRQTNQRPQSTNSDLEQLRLSKDDLRLKLQSRQHKPLSEYKGPLNIVKKQRPDGTEYVVGVNSRPAPAKPVADLRQTIKGKAAAGKENARGAREEVGSSESEAAGKALQAAAEAYIEVMRIPAVSSTLPAPGADQSFDDEPVPAPPAPASAPGVDVPTFLAQVFSHAEAAAAGREVGAQQQHGGVIASSSSSSSSAAAAATPGLGRPVRQPVPGIARRAAASVENREVEMANLADVCEELRCTMVKYEFATGRQDTAPGLFRRPVQQGYTEFLYKTSMRCRLVLSPTPPASRPPSVCIVSLSTSSLLCRHNRKQSPSLWLPCAYAGSLSISGNPTRPARPSRSESREQSTRPTRPSR